MKKTLLLALILSLALLLVGCGAGNDAPADDMYADDMPAEEPMDDMPADDMAEEPADDMADDAADDEPVALAEVEGCTDSDGGLNYEEYGVVVEGNLQEEDTCSRSDVYQGRLYEEYCDENGEHARMTYDCPSGMCVDGACVAEGATASEETADAEEASEEAME